MSTVVINPADIKIGDVVSFWGNEGQGKTVLAIARTNEEYEALCGHRGLPEGWTYVSTYLDADGRSWNGMTFSRGEAHLH